MKENKLTPEEVKKALECCGTEDGCLSCPLLEINVSECGMRLCRESLELHKSQQAEIERLQTGKENLRCVIEDLSNNTEHAIAEAVKEFAERVKSFTEQTAFADCWSEGGFLGSIDNLVKEMAGEDK